MQPLNVHTSVPNSSRINSAAGPVRSSSGQPVQSSGSLEPRDTVTLSESAKKGGDPNYSVRFNFINDNGPAFMSRHLSEDRHRQPGTQDYADDDGWTSDLNLQLVRQAGSKETVAGGRLRMLTQTGSWQRDEPGSQYQGLRTDIGEVVVQKNRTTQLDPKTELTFGVGGGVQAIGNLGGESVQRWWHKEGPLGGRTGTDLQGQYTSEGARVMPMVTGGVGVTRELSKNLDLNLSGQANVPLGAGVGQASAIASISSQLGPFNVELGGRVDGAWSHAPETSFHDINGVRGGAFGRVELEGKYGSLYSQVETGGFRDEPTFSLGVRFDIGKKPKLDPFR